MKKITNKTKLSEVIENEKAAEMLMERGISCLGCPMAMQETIEEGCLAHGMTKKEIDELIKRMNSGKKITWN
jgi:hydroxylamine reductase